MVTAHRLFTILLFLLLLASTGYSQNCFDKFYNEGQRLFSNRDYKGALDQYRAARQCDDCRGENRTIIEREIEKAEEERVKALERQTKIAEERRREANKEKKKAEALARRAIINELILIAENEYSRENYEESTLVYEFMLRYIDSTDIRAQIGYIKALYHDQNAYKYALHRNLQASNYRKHNRFVKTICPIESTSYIASGGWDKEVHIWDTRSGAQICRQDSLPAFVTSIINFPIEEGKKSLLVTSFSNGTVLTFHFDPEEETMIALDEIKIKANKRLFLEKIAGTDLFITYSSRRDLALWKREGVKIASVQEIRPESTDFIRDFQPKPVPNSPNIVYFENHEVFLIDTQTKRKVRLPLPTSTWERSLFQSITVSPDGEYLLAGNRGGEIIGWALRDLRLVLPPTDFHDEPVAGLNFSQDGSLLFSSDKDGYLIVLDPTDNFRKIAELPFSGKINKGSGVATREALFLGSSNYIQSILLTPSRLWKYRSQVDSNYLSASETDQYNLVSALELPNVFDRVLADKDFVFLMALGDYFAQDAIYQTEKEETASIEKAEKCYRILLEQRPGHPQVVKGIAELYGNSGIRRFRERSYSKARALLDRALKLDPADERCKQYHGYLDFVEGKSLTKLRPALFVTEGDDLKDQMEAFGIRIQMLAHQGHWKENPALQRQVFELLYLIKLLPTEEDMIAYGLPPEMLRSGLPPETFRKSFESCQFDSLTTAQLLTYYGGITSERQELLGDLPDTAYVARIAPSRELIEGLKKVYALIDYPIADNEKIGEALGNHSYYLLFDRRYEEAIAAAQEASECSEAIWPKTNLGHGYLLSGQREKAIAVYASIKDIIYEGGENKRPFSRVLIEDFCDLSRAGIKSTEFLYIVKNVLTDEELSKEEAALLNN